jgi:hypothetical protein
MKTNPLHHIKIASPCSADWNEMRGDNRQRYCSECKLNVYNLSEMTRREAENLLFEKEGKMCVRLYKRSDGTVITQNCPVGWQGIKRKVSRVATAVFSLLAGFLGGLWSFNQISNAYGNSVQQIANDEKKYTVPNFEESEILIEEGKLSFEKPQTVFVGRVDNSAFIAESAPMKPEKKNSQKSIDFSINGGISNGPDLMSLFTERYPKNSK